MTSGRVVKGVDWVLLLVVASQLIAGTLFVYSASGGYAHKVFGDSLHVFHQHVIQVLLSLLIGLITYRFLPLPLLKKNAHWLLMFSMILLAIPLVPGVGQAINGAYRGLSVGAIVIYVMPIATLFFVFFISRFLAECLGQERVSTPLDLKLLTIVAVVFLLSALQPDMVGASMLVTLVVLMCFVVRRYRIAIFLMATFAMLNVGFMLSQPYLLQRLASYLDPFADRFSSGYQLATSLIAISGGGLFGVGYGEGVVKSQLPGAHDGFIFSVLIEETGVAGGGVVLVLSAIIFARCFMIAQRLLINEQLFEGLLVMGLALWMALSAIIQGCSSLGLLPTIQVAYPLISYGGTYLLLFVMSLSIILKIGAGLPNRDLDGQLIFRSPIFVGIVALFSVITLQAVSTAMFNPSLDSKYESLSQSLGNPP